MSKQFIPTEEQITAWVLGELDSVEAEWVEAAVQGDPELQALAEAIRMTVNLSEEAYADLHQEETAALTDEQHAEIDSAAGTVIPLKRQNTIWKGVVRYGVMAASLVLVASLMLPALSRSRDAARRATPENDQKQRELNRLIMAQDSASVVSQEQVDQMRADYDAAVGGKENEELARSPLDESRYGNDLADAEPITYYAIPESKVDDLSLEVQLVNPGSPDQDFGLKDSTGETVHVEAAVSAGSSSGGLRNGAGGPNASSPAVQGDPQRGSTIPRLWYRENAPNVDSSGLSNMSISADSVTSVNGNQQGQPMPAPETERLHSLGYIDGNGDVVKKSEPSQVASARGEVRLQSVKADGRYQVADSIQLYQQYPSQNPITPGTEAYEQIIENTFKAVSQHPLSTFSIDVDTASYANMRRFLMNGSLPPVDAVRVEELINYFNYQYAPPVGEHPFSANIEVTSAPWQAQHRLVRVGLKGKEIENEERPASNLVFLIDVSGSMSSENKLPLVQKALRLLTTQLTANDRVAMVVYAGSSGLVLPSTRANNKSTIYAAIDRLKSGGSTNGGAGIQLAYQVARNNFIDGGVNRVILATDGDFNVGVTNRSDLVRNIESNAKSGTFLSVMGFGMGNLKDATMEQLADKGNGNYAYIDTYREAKKVLVEEMAGTLVTIAKDVKIQVEFNPAKVQSYRLIGYENRALANRDFNDDTKDAGEIGAGHTVTALYEIVPVGVPGVNTGGVDALRYQLQAEPQANARIAVPEAVSNEMLTVKLRYKQPDGQVSQLVQFNVEDDGLDYSQASTEFKFAAAVASFGQVLRNSPHVQGIDYNMVYSLAEAGLPNDQYGYRAEFMDLIRKAGQLRGFQMIQPSASVPELQFLELRKSGNDYRVRIFTGQGRARWYKEGDRFESYEISLIDPESNTVTIYSELEKMATRLTLKSSDVILR
jgi:Ca-activated chloride channel family protein